MNANFEMPNAHAIELMDFMNRPAGNSLIQALISRRPERTGETMEIRAINGAILEGWERCVDEITLIARERQGAVDIGQPKFINPSLQDDKDPDKRPPSTQKL